MRPLFAPWRMDYILSTDAPEAGCIFCSRPARGPAHFRESLILCATEYSFAIMNKYPYSGGHIMVIPLRHVADPILLPENEYRDLTELLRSSVNAMREPLAPHGFNVGMNMGRVAGAGIDQHCHYHIVPRWNGDVNFMPVLSDTRMINDSIESTYAHLLPHFAKLGTPPQSGT